MVISNIFLLIYSLKATFETERIIVGDRSILHKLIDTDKAKAVTKDDNIIFENNSLKPTIDPNITKNADFQEKIASISIDKLMSTENMVNMKDSIAKSSHNSENFMTNEVYKKLKNCQQHMKNTRLSDKDERNLESYYQDIEEHKGQIFSSSPVIQKDILLANNQPNKGLISRSQSLYYPDRTNSFEFDSEHGINRPFKHKIIKGWCGEIIKGFFSFSS